MLRGIVGDEGRERFDGSALDIWTGVTFILATNFQNAPSFWK